MAAASSWDAAAVFPHTDRLFAPSRAGAAASFRRSSDSRLWGHGPRGSLRLPGFTPVTGFRHKGPLGSTQRRYRSGFSPDCLVQPRRRFCSARATEWMVFVGIGPAGTRRSGDALMIQFAQPRTESIMAFKFSSLQFSGTSQPLPSTRPPALMDIWIRSSQ